MAYDDGYYYGLAKLVVLSDKSTDDGKTVTVTNGTKTFTGTMADGKCEFKIPGKDIYEIRLGAETCKVDISYGECAEVYVPQGKKDVAEEKASINAIKTEMQANFQAGVDSVYNAVVAKGTTPASKALSDVVTGISNIGTVDKTNTFGVYAYSGVGSESNPNTQTRQRNVTLSQPQTVAYFLSTGEYAGGYDGTATIHKNWVKVAESPKQGMTSGKITCNTNDVITITATSTSRGYSGPTASAFVVAIGN